MEMDNDKLCSCGSGKKLVDCCLPVIEGIESASTAEQLMRSRYTAYALEDGDYLLRSWHADTRPHSISVNKDALTWTGLTVCGCSDGQHDDESGEVEFIACYEQSGRSGKVHENSRVVFEQGQWLYLDGETKPTIKVGRNSLCPCGSGKKYKRCCGQKADE